MRTFNFCQEIKAATYAEADIKAEELGLEQLVSDQTFERLKVFVKNFVEGHGEYIGTNSDQEDIGNRTMYIAIKTEEEETPKIHIAVCVMDDDYCVLTDVQRTEIKAYAESYFGEEMDFVSWEEMQ